MALILPSFPPPFPPPFQRSFPPEIRVRPPTCRELSAPADSVSPQPSSRRVRESRVVDLEACRPWAAACAASLSWRTPVRTCPPPRRAERRRSRHASARTHLHRGLIRG